MPKTNQARAEEPLSSSPAATATDWPELAHRELVSRVVASPTFARSERLSTLLTYICETSLKGRNADLNEQRIGHAVFGRARDYDSSGDGIVRTQASRLRQRLDLYFSQEGAEEPVRIIIPKGGYVPIFTPQPKQQEPLPQRVSLPPSPVTAVTEAPAKHTRMLGLMPWLLFGVVTTLAGLIVGRSLQKQSMTPRPAAETHPLWREIFTPQQPTLVVPADSGLVLSHAFDQRSVSLQQYLAGDYRRPGSEPEPVPEMRILHSNFANRRYTSIVDLEAAVWLAQRAQSARSSLQVRYARDLRPNDLKNGNVIILGAFEANPWVELFERNMNFVLRNDYRTGSFSVINKSPRPGEPALWQSKTDDPQKRVYGVVAFTPNLLGSGNALLVQGTSMAGTEAAWDFASDDAVLLPFLKRIQRPDGKIPYFELLLGTQNMSSSAVRSNVLAWRVATDRDDK
jgi:hypothetical protein